MLGLLRLNSQHLLFGATNAVVPFERLEEIALGADSDLALRQPGLRVFDGLHQAFTNGRKVGDDGYILALQYSLHLQLDDDQIAKINDWREKATNLKALQDAQYSLTEKLQAQGIEGVDLSNNPDYKEAADKIVALQDEIRTSYVPKDRLPLEIKQACPNMPYPVITTLLFKDGQDSKIGENTLTFQKGLRADRQWLAAARD
jgi:hypothetical protein